MLCCQDPQKNRSHHCCQFGSFTEAAAADADSLLEGGRITTLSPSLPKKSLLRAVSSMNCSDCEVASCRCNCSYRCFSFSSCNRDKTARSCFCHNVAIEETRFLMVNTETTMTARNSALFMYVLSYVLTPIGIRDIIGHGRSIEA